MKMKKIIIYLLIFSMILGMTPQLQAKAEDTPPTIYASDISGYAGNYVYAYIYGKDLVSVAGMNLSAKYSSEVLSVYSQSATGIAASQVCSTNNDEIEGLASFSLVSLDGVSGEGQLWRIQFQIAQDATPGDYTVTLMAGEVYDTSIQDIQVVTQNFKVTVKEPAATVKNVDFYTSVGKELNEGETTDVNLYTNNANGFASAEIEVEYDPAYLQLETTTLATKLTSAEGAVYLINDDTPGYLKISYTCLGSITGSVNPMVTLSFKSLQNEETTSQIDFKITGLYDVDLQAMKANAPSATVVLHKVEEPERYPIVKVADSESKQATITVDITAEGKSNLAAGDFTVTYDSNALTCTGIAKVIDGSFVVSNPDMENGTAKFSFMKEDGITEDSVIARLTFDVLAYGTSTMDVTGMNTVNGSLTKIPLEYQSGTITTIDPVTELKVAAATLSLSTDIAIRFYAKASVLDQYADYYLQAEFLGYTEQLRKDADVQYIQGEMYYLFTYEGISPSKLNEDVTVKLYAGTDGTNYLEGQELKYGAYSYCYNMLGKTTTSSSLKRLIVDLLNYGAATQVYTNYKTDDLVNANLTDEQKSLGTADTPSMSSVTAISETGATFATWYGANLTLDSSITVWLYFKADEVNGLVATIDYGGDEKWTSDQFEKTTLNGVECYSIKFDAMKASELKNILSITLQNQNGDASKTLTYSVESYAYSKQNSTTPGLKDLVISMMKYMNSVDAHVNK